MNMVLCSRKLLRRVAVELPCLALFLCLFGGVGFAQLPTPSSPSVVSPTQSTPSASAVDSVTGTTLTADQAVLYPQTPETVLAAGDQITIRLFGDADYNFAGRISTDGTVLLPLLGVVHLEGMSITQAEIALARQLEVAGMYRDPQVILGPNAVVTLGGEMHAVVPVVGARTLYGIIAAGGGLPNTASRTVQIIRPGRSEPISVELGTDPGHSRAGLIPVFPGDTVLVSHLGVIYMAGEFRTPGVVQMTNYSPLTLTQVSAMVGGPVWDARYSELHIIRTVGDHRTVTTLNIKDVLYGKRPDPIMQPNDIVFLPPSAFKSSLANGSLGSVLGLVSFSVALFYQLR